MIRRSAILLALLCALSAAPAAAQADFGFVPGSVKATALNRDGSVERQAGAHPYSYTVQFELKTNPGGESEGGPMRDVIIDAPPGLVGNPEAIPSCPRQSFEGGTPSCLPSTQIGVLKAFLPGSGVGSALGPIYNLTPPPGVAAQFGFTGSGFTALQSATVGPEGGYGVRVAAPDLPIEVTEVTATLWGVPADEGHTPERGPETVNGGVKSDAPLLPFLTLPTSCEAPPLLTVSIDSKFNPGVFVSETVPAREEAGNPAAMIGCEAVPFVPQILASPSTSAADSAAGLDFELKLPNEGLLNPEDGAIAETQPERTEVLFPPGIAVNPAAANGIAACSPDRFKAESAASLPGQGCPEASKVGTLFAQTPLLAEAIEGSVYLASPRDNPFDSFLAVYIVARVPERGVLVKQAVEVRADPVTGQLRSIVGGLPPIPYSSFELALREGPRAPLVTPQLCGTYTTEVRLFPFSDPDTATLRTAPFTITTGAGGGACASSEAQLPLHPTLEAGSTTPLAGAYSPFVFRVSRADGEQRFSSLTATLPKGLVARLAGVPYCPEPQIAAAKAREVEGGGAAELASPSCPSASQVGSVNVAAGAGPSPYYVQGKAYLAGPYKGAPLSLAIITPALAGPFDLGAVVARAGLYVDETSAVVTVRSDPIPTILGGIPLDVRKIAVNTDRRDFTLNPTSCEVKAVEGTLTSTTGQTAALSNRFQVGGCRGLGFRPKLAISLKGGTRRSQNPALKAVLTYPRGGPYANIAKAQVTLPHSAFLEQGHIKTVCTRPQLASASCPEASIYGRARAISPLLDKPLSGPVYLGVGFGHKLPDLVADLNGQIRFLLNGRVDTGRGDGLRNTFSLVPDAPVSRFILEMDGGRKGLIVNSENLCGPRAKTRAVVDFTAHNGKTLHLEPRVANSCRKAGKGR